MKLLTKVTFATLITGIALAPALVSAHGKEGRIYNRLERQHYRIENGIDSGELTRKEAKKLRREQRKIRKMARRFHKDGVLTRQERNEIRDRLDRASDRIWAFKHNDWYCCDYHHHEYSYHDRGHHKHEGSRRSSRWSDNFDYKSGYRLIWYQSFLHRSHALAWGRK